MTRMVRKQIYIPKDQETILKRLARRRGLSESELIRQAIDRDVVASAPRPFRRDPEAWDKAYRFMMARRTRATGAQPYRWKRDDAYEERQRAFENNK